ncbi:MAG: hypothetical protein RIG77_10750 [Cyclobacteriaceae bacterium]
MKKKRSKPVFYWEMHYAMIYILPIVIVLIFSYQIYEKYFAPEPINEAYCYCIDSKSRLYYAELHFRAEDAQKSAEKMIKCQFDETASDRITPGSLVSIYRYYGDPVVAKVEWTWTSFRGTEITESGWVPIKCLHDTIDSRLIR